MIVIYETYATDDIHVTFNAGLIETAALAFPGEVIRFYAGASNLRHLESFLNGRLGRRIEFREIDIPDQNAGNFSYARKIYNGLGKIKRETPRGSLLIMSYVTAISLILLKFSLYFNRHFCAAQVVLHGNLAEIDGWRSRNPLFRYLNLRGALCFFNAPHLRYLILEQAIVPELLRRMPALQPFIDVFLHPITVDPKNTPRDNIMLSQPVTIGYLGLVTQLKGFPVFQAIAQAMKKRLGKKVSFVAIGHTKGRPLMKDLDCLDVLPKTSSLSHEEFTRLAASCHFICLPFSAALYALSPSGTLLDAVALQKPVIALDVAITRDLFARYGDIGYLCSTPEEICQTIDQIVKNVDCEHYRRQQTAIATACHARQPAELAKSYVKITRPLINQQP